MMNKTKTLEHILQEADKELQQASRADTIETIRIQLLGRKGRITQLFKELAQALPEERAQLGKALNIAKADIQKRIGEKNIELKRNEPKSQATKLDLTLPGRSRGIGYIHPIRRVLNDCIAIFRTLGFIVAEGPEIEDSYHNFDALNTPENHPARDEQDTFYLADDRLLRTQTSPVQIRVMEKQKPPIRIIAPGRCYRRDRIDATHNSNFHQIEGLYVDTNVSMVDLKSTLSYFIREFFEQETVFRLRPHFFPFTEPSVECDILWTDKHTDDKPRWLEIAGAGMVHPNVFKAKSIDYDPEIYTGFAFGIGIDRLAMLRYRINDIRLLYSNDIRLLHQL